MQCPEPFNKTLKNSYKLLFIALVSLIFIHLADSNASGFLLLVFAVSLFIGITCLLLDLVLILFKFAGPTLLLIALVSFIFIHLAGASELLILVFTGSLVIGIPCLLLGLVLMFLRFLGPSIPGTIFKMLMNIAYYLATIIISVLITAILLNFIPIKFAIKLDDAEKHLTKDSYICRTTPVTPIIGWCVDNEVNKHLDNILSFRVAGSSPEKYLSERTFDFKWYELFNQYLLVGYVSDPKMDKETGVIFADLNVTEWQIIYPIRRATLRQYFTPKGYLTVYDYDWLIIIKSL